MPKHYKSIKYKFSKGKNKMKNMKKLSAIVLSVVMILTMSLSTFAFDITLESATQTPTKDHTYDIYQIFTGDLEAGVLANIKYGANYGATGTAVPKSELDAITDARAFAKKLVNEELLNGDAVATLNEANNWAAKDLAAGYYLIVEKTTQENLPEGETLSAYIVQVKDDVVMSPKSGITSIDKIISDDDNQIPNILDITADGKFDNVSIGSNVEFTLTAPIVSNADDFDFCYFIINDTICEGFTFNNDITVTIGGHPVTEGVDYTVFTGAEADGYTFRVALLNAKDYPGEEVVVKYTALLNDKAVIGELKGNPNKANLTYSNNPEFDYDGTHENGKPKEEFEGGNKKLPLGVTVDIWTRTYTTGIKVVKVDENGNALPGASFKLEGKNVVGVLVKREVFTEAENGEYWLLKNGFYTKDDPATEEMDTSLYADVNKKYTKKIETVQDTNVTDMLVEGQVGANGVIIFDGLGEGTFTITETVTPAGYNTIAPFDVVIEWDAPVAGSIDCDWTVTVADKAIDVNEEGVFEFEVVNHSGIELPDTGGIGTTIFYVVGAALVVFAVVILVTRKRMSKDN